MPDFDDLSRFSDGFSEGAPVNPLPASEVRRRGDRMRRRNTALAAVGGVAAAAVLIGTPFALVGGGGDGDRDVEPAPAPTQTDRPAPEWITEIPEDFPVTAGMTETGTPTEGDLDAFALCDVAYPTPQGTTDVTN